jgi:hypothetical protein
MTTKSWRDFLPIHPAAELFPQRPLTIGDNHRMKRGEHVAKQPDTDPYTIETIAGTCLDRTDDHDELLKLNRGAEPGTLAAHKPKLAPNGKAAFYCSFSGKSQHDVAKAVCIYNECADLCIDIIRQRKAAAAHKEVAASPESGDGLDIPPSPRRAAQ